MLNFDYRNNNNNNLVNMDPEYLIPKPINYENISNYEYMD